MDARSGIRTVTLPGGGAFLLRSNGTKPEGTPALLLPAPPRFLGKLERRDYKWDRAVADRLIGSSTTTAGRRSATEVGDGRVVTGLRLRIAAVRSAHLSLVFVWLLLLVVVARDTAAEEGVRARQRMHEF